LPNKTDANLPKLEQLSLGELQDTITGTTSYYVNEDYPTGRKIEEHLTESINVTQNRPL